MKEKNNTQGLITRKQTKPRPVASASPHPIEITVWMGVKKEKYKTKINSIIETGLKTSKHPKPRQVVSAATSHHKNERNVVEDLIYVYDICICIIYIDYDNFRSDCLTDQITHEIPHTTLSGAILWIGLSEAPRICRSWRVDSGDRSEILFDWGMGYCYWHIGII